MTSLRRHTVLTTPHGWADGIDTRSSAVGWTVDRPTVVDPPDPCLVDHGVDTGMPGPSTSLARGHL